MMELFSFFYISFVATVIVTVLVAACHCLVSHSATLWKVGRVKERREGRGWMWEPTKSSDEGKGTNDWSNHPTILCCCCCCGGREKKVGLIVQA